MHPIASKYKEGVTCENLITGWCNQRSAMATGNGLKNVRIVENILLYSGTKSPLSPLHYCVQRMNSSNVSFQCADEHKIHVVHTGNRDDTMSRDVHNISVSLSETIVFLKASVSLI